MNEMSVFIWADDLTQVTGERFYEINGAGRDKREALSEIVEAYVN